MAYTVLDAMTQISDATASPTASDLPVITTRVGHLGHIMLNRPRAINALTHDMVVMVQTTLDDWAADDSVETVVLSGAGERGLCAGGDIVSMYHDAIAGGTASAQFWAAEYHLNAAIAEYPKPFVALMDGIVLGGGIGLSAHSSVRVVTERSSIGMPETGIGFIPDVGGTYLLSHAPGELGTHLALTGGSVGAGDAIGLGLADWYMPSERLPGLLEAMTTDDAVSAVQKRAEPAPASTLLAHRSWIDEHYRGDDVIAIVERLSTSSHDSARDAATLVRAKSPTSVTLALRALRQAASMTDLRDALDLEYRLMVRLHATAPDFVEGVRAQVVDKDRNPRWSPPTLSQVENTDAFFDLLPHELGLGTR